MHKALPHGQGKTSYAWQIQTFLIHFYSPCKWLVMSILRRTQPISVKFYSEQEQHRIFLCWDAEVDFRFVGVEDETSDKAWALGCGWSCSSILASKPACALRVPPTTATTLPLLCNHAITMLNLVTAASAGKGRVGIKSFAKAMHSWRKVGMGMASEQVWGHTGSWMPSAVQRKKSACSPVVLQYAGGKVVPEAT